LLATPADPAQDTLLWSPAGGRPLLAWSAAVFEATPGVTDSLVLVPAARLAETDALIAASGWRRVRPLVVAAEAEPLAAALAALSEGVRYVVLHDAARPLVTPELVADVLAAAHATGMAVAITPVKETIKRVEGESVVETLPRGELALLQTPLAIRRDLLGTLLRASSSGRLSDLAAELAARALAQSISVATVPAGHEHLRVTSAIDLAVAEALLRRQAEPA
jgi:2-C-methyl-D-erythritol 4-phosphate cytidylyltransferase